MKANKNRVWAEISLDAIEHNYLVICAQAKAPVLAVVKADAYGHGAVAVAKRLEAYHPPYFAVATVEEGIELREADVRTPILILGYVGVADMETAINHDITVPIYDSESAALFSAAALKLGKTVTVHYKLDTGMTRLGFPSWETETTIEQILAISRLPGLMSEGIFTHFAVADTADGGDYTNLQYKRFTTICDSLQHAGLDLPLRHCANSGAISAYEQMHCTMTRAGIILYGYRPDPAVACPLDLKPAMTVKARVVQVREIPADTTISYGRTYKSSQPMHVAVLSIGYADGFLRTGSSKAHVLIGDQKTPILGRICMDMCMAQIPDGVTLHRDDVVTVMDDTHWTADDVAAAAGTISYEVLCEYSSRVSKFYK